MLNRVSWFALYACFFAVLVQSSPINVVDVGYASYQGNLSYPDVVAYLGIPYAEPPLGDRRFRAAIALNTTRVAEQAGSEVVNASTYPEFCVQGTTGDFDAGGAGSEDCLKVNIYAPAGAKKGDNLPVLVYVHGGAYVFGNPGNWPFDHWVHQSPNVVIVSVYYRLDSFGFLAVPEFKDSSLGDFNAGFTDQVQALRWVQQNIASFGGDPNKVTINGQSAGASSVELHLVTDQENLFSSAIAQSVYRTPLPTPQQQQPLFNFYATHAGCGSGSVSSQMACLRNASISALARAQDAAFYNLTLAYNLFHPVIDGSIITQLPTLSLEQGKFRDVPLIVGSTSNETMSLGPITLALKKFFPALKLQSLLDYLSVYVQADFDSLSQWHQVATGESELICARTFMGAAFASKSKAWTYRYNTANPTSGSDAVGHAADNWMMFQGRDTGPNGTATVSPMTPQEDAFAEELIAYWLSFVRSGDPNTYKLARSPSWPQYMNATKERIVLQEGSTNTSASYVEAEPLAESSRCEFVKNKTQELQD